MHRAPTGLVLAGVAVGMAVGTKWTALLALPGLAVVFLALFWRRLDRGILAGVAIGGVAAVLLGAQSYVQNLLVFGSPTGVASRFRTPAMPWEGPVAYLARMLYQFTIADLSGPLAAPAAQPLAAWLAQALAAIGERLFAGLGIPIDVEGRVGVSVLFAPRIEELYSGVGQVGGLMIVAALVALIWPRRIPPRRRLVGLVALSHLVFLALTLRWSAFGPGRFIITACALAAPLLGALLEMTDDRRRGTTEPARRRWPVVRLGVLALALWSGVAGLYVARFNEDKPLSALAGRDRLGLMILNFPLLEAFFREVDEELGPTSMVGVFGVPTTSNSWKGQWEYLFFGPRFSRTLLPLVGPGYAERQALRQPPRWSNEDLLAAYRPTFVVLEGLRPGAQALPEMRDRCFELPLEHAKPTLPWELWRCQDGDPRSVLEHGDFRDWPTGRLPGGWAVEVAGEGRLDVRRLEPAEGEPFRLRLAYQAGDAQAEAGIVQEVAVGALRGRTLVVDARVWADQVGAAVLWVDDGVEATEVANATTEAETLRVVHAVHPRASELAVHLDASGAGRDAVVLVRTILAIPREAARGG
ncbi:MAG: hypothetical protein H0V51_19555 [Chloroflexi bacterium]|nr:hypothetical protein [Chloroflexota bacterium]